MSDDESMPPEMGYGLLEDKQLNAEFEAYLGKVLDDAFGPAPPPRPPPPSHWPELSAEVSYAAMMHRLDPKTYAREKIGRFEGLATIGEGGFGTVFKVWDPDLERVEALKLCRVDRPGADKALLEEAKILASIKHPNIIAARAVGRYGDAIFLVSEYVDGLNIYDLAIEGEGLLRWEVVLDLFISVGKTLADAHDAGITHGDLKPENILVELETRQTYLVDFGLARIMSPTPEQLAHGSGGLGTSYYMAPELLRGARADRSSDQYAFAVSLWHSLEGRVPYIGDSDGLLDAIEYGEPMRWRPDVPERVYEVIRKGFGDKRDARYADMRAFVRALELARGPVLVPEPPGQVVSVEPASEQRSKRNGSGPVFGLMLLVGVAGVLGERYLAHRAEPVADATTLSEDADETKPRTSSERDLPEDADASELARQGFAAAQRALDAGDVRGCYDKWKDALSELVTIDPAQAGELSLTLADNVNASHPGRLSSAWIVAGAAESFEQAAMWARAAEARERAAELYRAANAPEDARDEEECRAKNEKHLVCRFTQTRGD